MAVYDDEKTKQDAAADLRRRTGISEDEEGAMDREATNGAAEDIGERSLSSEALSAAEAEQGESEASEETASETEALAEHEQQIGEGYKEEKKGRGTKLLARFAGVSGRKKALVGGGAFGTILVGIFLLFLTFLPLKINHIIENLTSHFYASSESAVGDRTEILFSKYITKHVLPSLGGTCTNSSRTIDKNCINAIDGETPAAKLFRGWRDARIENTLASKYGIEFTRVDTVSGPTYNLSVDGGKSNINITGFRNNPESNLFEAVGGSRNDIRQKVQEAFSQETLWKRVMYRFKVGRLLERKYGIERCLFICKQKDTFADWKDAKTGQVKQKIATSLLAVRVLGTRAQATGFILGCLISGDCNSYTSTGKDNERQDGFEKQMAGALEELQAKLGKETVDNLLKEAKDFSDSGGLGKYIANKIIDKFVTDEATKEGLGNVVPVLGQINTVAGIITKVKNGASNIKRWIYVANATAMVSVFVMYRSHADELKDGQVDPALLGEMVKSLGSNAGDADHQGQPAESTPLYSDLMGSKPATTTSILNIFSPSAYAQSTSPAPSKYTCRNDQPVPAGQQVCAEENLKTGGVVGTLTDLINGPFKPISDAADIWNSYLGGYVFGLISKGGALVGDTISNLPGVKQIISLVGDGVGSLMEKFIQSVADYLFPSPISDNPSGGSTFDNIAGGADVSGNDYAQYGTGAAKISDTTAAEIRTQQENDARQQFAAQPFFARMFSRDSPYSFVSQVAMSLPTNVTDFSQSSFASLISEPFTKLARAFSSLFTTRLSYAATASPDPFGVPQFGYNPGDPSLNMNPDIFTDAYCTKMNSDWVAHDIHITNYDTGDYTTSDLGQDPSTGTDVHTTTNPCLLESAATGSAGGLFTDDVLTKADMTDPGGSPSAGTGSGTLVAGQAKDLATQIRANPNITYDYGRDGSIGSQMQAIADGQNPAVCAGRSMDPVILGIILTLAQSHQVNISSLIRPEDPCDQSPHANACAVDINHFDGQQLVGDDSKSIELINDVIGIVPTTQKLGFGVGNDGPAVGGVNKQGHSVEFFSDNPSHVHVDTRCHV